jgi:hypothetical protein
MTRHTLAFAGSLVFLFYGASAQAESTPSNLPLTGAQLRDLRSELGAAEPRVADQRARETSNPLQPATQQPITAMTLRTTAEDSEVRGTFAHSFGDLTLGLSLTTALDSGSKTRGSVGTLDGFADRLLAGVDLAYVFLPGWGGLDEYLRDKCGGDPVPGSFCAVSDRSDTLREYEAEVRGKLPVYLRTRAEVGYRSLTWQDSTRSGDEQTDSTVPWSASLAVGRYMTAAGVLALGVGYEFSVEDPKERALCTIPAAGTSTPMTLTCPIAPVAPLTRAQSLVTRLDWRHLVGTHFGYSVSAIGTTGALGRDDPDSDLNDTVFRLREFAVEVPLYLRLGKSSAFYAGLAPRVSVDFITKASGVTFNDPTLSLFLGGVFDVMGGKEKPLK